MTTQIPWGWIIGGIAAGAAFGLTVPVTTQTRARRNPIGAKKNPVDLQMLKDEYGIDGRGKTKSQILQAVEEKLTAESKEAVNYTSSLTAAQIGELDAKKSKIRTLQDEIQELEKITKDAKEEIKKVEADKTKTKRAKTAEKKALEDIATDATSQKTVKKPELKKAKDDLSQHEAKLQREKGAAVYPKVKSLEHIVYQLWDEEDEEEAAEQKEREIMKKALQRSKEKRPSLYGSGTKVKRRSRNN